MPIGQTATTTLGTFWRQEETDSLGQGQGQMGPCLYFCLLASFCMQKAGTFWAGPLHLTQAFWTGEGNFLLFPLWPSASWEEEHYSSLLKKTGSYLSPRSWAGQTGLEQADFPSTSSMPCLPGRRRRRRREASNFPATLHLYTHHHHCTPLGQERQKQRLVVKHIPTTLCLQLPSYTICEIVPFFHLFCACYAYLLACLCHAYCYACL